MVFTKKKFKSLPLLQQHKKLAEILREHYENMLLGNTQAFNLQNYHTLLSFLTSDLTPLPASLESLSNRYHLHLAQAQQSLKEHRLLPKVTYKDLTNINSPRLPVSVYLDHIRSAHNVGSIIRTAEAFGFSSVLFSEMTPFTDQQQVINTAMGCIEWLTCEKLLDFSKIPRPLIALETSPDALDIHHFIFPESFTLALGNEEYGCSEELLKNADFILQIPMHGHKNSLNVANAFAVAAGKVCQQKALTSKYG